MYLFTTLIWTNGVYGVFFHCPTAQERATVRVRDCNQYLTQITIFYQYACTAK
jgi:hypothetical protein